MSEDFKKSLKKKMKTGPFWVALASAIITAAASVALVGGFVIPEELQTNIMVAVVSILGIFVVLGLVTSPKDDDDDKKDKGNKN